jgi:hypothetical protein
MGIKKFTFFIPALLFFLVIGVGVLLVPVIGPAWDEPDNIFSGGQYLNFFTGGFNPEVLTPDKASSYFGDIVYPLDTALAHLPPVANYIGTAFTLIAEKSGAPHTGTTAIIAYHLMTVLFFAILVTTTYSFGILLGLPVWVSVFAALATFLYPTLFGHGLSDSKDTAQAGLFTLSLYLLVKGVKYQTTRNLIAGAIVWGLALATKFNAIYIPIIWGLWCGSRSMVFRARGFKLQYIFILALGLITAFAVWPYLWYRPLERISEVVTYFTHVGQGYLFYFGGNSYQSGVGKSFWWYPWISLVICTPLQILVFMGYGIVVLIRRLFQQSDRLILVIWILIPMMRAILPGAALYDQLRHFVEIIPACMLLAGIGIEAVSKYGKTGMYVAYTIAVFVVVSLFGINVKYFPHSAGYYNILAGDANKNYDREIEGLSVKEGIDYLHTTYGAIHLWVITAGHLSWYYINEDDRYVFSKEEADSIIVINKRSHIGPGDAPVIDMFRVDHVVERGDAVFAWVFRRL